MLLLESRVCNVQKRTKQWWKHQSCKDKSCQQGLNRSWLANGVQFTSKESNSSTCESWLFVLFVNTVDEPRRKKEKSLATRRSFLYHYPQVRSVASVTQVTHTSLGRVLSSDALSFLSIFITRKHIHKYSLLPSLSIVTMYFITRHIKDDLEDISFCYMIVH